MFELNNKNMKKILLIITFSLILAFFLFNFSGAMSTLSIIINIINPLIYGFCIAFILNIIMKKYEKILNKKNKKHRKLSITLSILSIILIIILTLFLIIPQIINTIKILITNLPTTWEIIKNWIETLTINNPQIFNIIQNFNPNWDEIIKNASEFIQNNAGGILGSSLKYVNNLINIIVNLCLGSIIAIYMLTKKEFLINEFKKILKKKQSEKQYNKLINFGNLANTKFQKYFVGQFIGSVFIAITTFILMLILNIPYAFTISILIGVLSLIPMFGIIISTIIGTILIIAINPIKALLFIILVFIVSQISDNFIMPKIVEKNLSLPSGLIFLAIIIGGNNFGIIGLITALPIASILYDLYKQYTK